MIGHPNHQLRIWRLMPRACASVAVVMARDKRISFLIFISIGRLDNTTVDGSEIRLTSWDVSKPVNNGISYQPQLVSLPDFWTINILDYRQVSNFKTTRFANLSSLGTWNLSSWVEELALLSSVKTNALLNIYIYTDLYSEILSLLDIRWFFLPLMAPSGNFILTNIER